MSGTLTGGGNSGDSVSGDCNSSPGGGGGCYGGGAGGGNWASGGGGGSSFIGSLADSETLSNIRSGDGEIVITYSEPIPTMSQWALLIMGLILTSMAVVTIRKSMLVRA